MIKQRFTQYAYLMRLNKPIPIFLLLWPTLWALWLSSHGSPDGNILVIFLSGVILMRSAGCIMNDFADRHFDGHVLRTKDRPLAAGKVGYFEVFMLLFILLLSAFLLVLQCNKLTILLAFIGVALVAIYPFLKRITHLPQLGLGIVFNWGIPMAFAAVNGALSPECWFLFLGAILWPVIYDTMYAMSDKEDDVRIGVKSTAILFGDSDKFIIGMLQIIFMVFLAGVGLFFQLGFVYYSGLLIVGLLFGYQQWLIRHRERESCLKAFLNNHWVGMVVFAGIFLSF